MRYVRPPWCHVLETLRWWLASTVVGVIALPYAFRLFRFLPDRGYTVARTLGVLLLVYPLWLLSVLGLLPFTAGAGVLVLAVLAAGAAVLAGRDRHALAAHLRDRRGLIIAAEVVFAAALIGIAVLRAYAPAIDATEKPFEYSMFTGVLHSLRMPPEDPWFGGQPLSYYYGGYLVAALLTKLTAVPPAYGFNLGLILTAALTAVSAFGLGANLVLAMGPRRREAPSSATGPHPPTPSPNIGTGGERLLPPMVRGLPSWSGVHAGKRSTRSPSPEIGRGGRRVRAGTTAALTGGVLSVVLLMVIGNLEGAFELAAAHGLGSPAFWQRLGIVNLTGLVHTHHWYPDEFWFWWRATRLGSNWNILEFPFFSFMLGDLHAHVMVLPFTLLGLTAIFGLLRAGAPLDRASLRHGPALVLFLGVLAGMLALSNTWDQPIFLLLLFAGALMLNAARTGLTWRAAGETAAFVVPVALLSFALYLPYFADQHASILGIRPTELLHPPTGIEGEAMVSPPHHFLIAWGPLLLVAASVIIAEAVRRRVWRASADAWGTALLLVLLPLLAWGAVVAVDQGSVAALADEVRARATWWAFGSYWLVQIFLLGLIALGGMALYVDTRRPHPERRAARTYLLLASVGGLLILHGIELFYVLEPSPSRINTLFKFSYIVWLLLATAGGAAVVDVLGPWLRRGSRIGAGVWATGAAAVLALALIYPVTAAMNRTNGFSGPMTLNGLAFAKSADPDDYAAQTWMAANLPGRPTILEATGHVYSEAGRVSGRTGFPTVIGWMEHQEKLRGGRDYDAMVRTVEARAADVDTIYTTTNVQQARDLLSRYGVDYVYAGPLETKQYGTAGMPKFDALGSVVYRNASVTIYRIGDGSPPVLGSRD
jgi:YYY domain-containing protein